MKRLGKRQERIDATALANQVRDNLTGIAQSQARLEAAAGSQPVPDAAALAGRPAGGYTLISTGERVWWDGQSITQRAVIGGIGISNQRLATDGIQFYIGGDAPQLEIRRGMKTWLMTGVLMAAAPAPHQAHFTERARTNMIVPFSVPVSTSTQKSAIEVLNAPKYRLWDGAPFLDFTFEDNALTLRPGSTTQWTGTYFDVADAYPWGSIMIELAQFGSTDPSAPKNDISVGIARPSDNSFFWAGYDPRNGTGGVYWKAPGAGGDQKINSYTLPKKAQQGFFRMAFQLLGPIYALIVDVGDGWQVAVTGAMPFDTRVRANLTDWKFVLLGVFDPPGTGAFKISGIHVGPSGGIGFRDPTLVVEPDGTPYRDVDGNVYVYATAAGQGLSSAHGVVYRVEWDAKRLTPVSTILWDGEGKIRGHHAGQLTHMGPNEWWVLTSTWGSENPAWDDPVKLVQATIQGDALSGRHVVVPQQVNLPTDTSVYDPSMIKKPGGDWLMIYAETAAAIRWNHVFTTRQAFSGNRAYWNPGKTIPHSGESFEGQKWVRVNGANYVMDGGNSGMRVFDENLNYLGMATLSYSAGIGTALPHPCIWQDGEKLRLLTFDDYRSIGDDRSTQGKAVWLESQ